MNQINDLFKLTLPHNIEINSVEEIEEDLDGSILDIDAFVSIANPDFEAG